MKIFTACGCNNGRIRKNNEDNFYFDGKSLPCVHNGTSKVLSTKFKTDKMQFLAVFDGMGGEESGEVASFTAAQTAGEFLKSKVCDNPENVLNELCDKMNMAVWTESKKLDFGSMGTTVASLLFYKDEVFCCNVGDSPVYRFRDGKLEKISLDHVEKLPANSRHKPRLIQYLGMPADEIRLEPYVATSESQKGDCYLICSDGITDMLTDEEIVNIITENKKVKKITEKLIDAAIEKGGRDNITAIFCCVD